MFRYGNANIKKYVHQRFQKELGTSPDCEQIEVLPCVPRSHRRRLRVERNPVEKH